MPAPLMATNGQLGPERRIFLPDAVEDRRRAFVFLLISVDLVPHNM
jgi:hypothetical protein